MSSAATPRVPSLGDYLLVAQTAVQVEHYQREPGGSWRYRLLEAGAILTLSNGATVAVDAIYEGAFELAAG